MPFWEIVAGLFSFFMLKYLFRIGFAIVVIGGLKALAEKKLEGIKQPKEDKEKWEQL